MPFLPDRGLHALTHVPSPRMSLCQLTYIPVQPIDLDRALVQHEAYSQALRQCGVQVQRLEINRDFPDGVFVEDTAIVLDEVAVLASMGTEARAAEPDGVAEVLRRYREVHRIELPATLEGGDVLRVGRTLFVGLTSRTNPAGIEALAAVGGPHGYKVIAVPVTGCLHLKTACTALTEETLLLNPAWVDVRPLQGFELLHVPDAEPFAANTLPIGGRVILSADHVRTADRVAHHGLEVVPVDISEFAKAEGGVTCLSLVFAGGAFP